MFSDGKRIGADEELAAIYIDGEHYPHLTHQIIEETSEQNPIETPDTD